MKNNRNFTLSPIFLHYKSNTKKTPEISREFYIGWKIGLEPTTFGTTIRRSNRLSYIHHFCFCVAKIERFSNSANKFSKKILVFFTFTSSRRNLYVACFNFSCSTHQLLIPLLTITSNQCIF